MAVKKKGKEYIKGNLEFEGEFLFNKKWNGKGYDKNNIEIYELKNGNGRVREYDLFEETLKYEGGYHNGKRSGQGQEFDGNKVIFSGEYSNGKRNGFGTRFYEDGVIFKGQYLGGKKNGKGKEYYQNRLIFEGEYSDGERNGKGREYNINNELIFEGEYVNGMRIKKEKNILKEN